MSQVMRKVVVGLLFSTGLLLLSILVAYLCIGAGCFGLGFVNRLYVDFIDLSLLYPKEKPSGVELISMGKDQAIINIKGEVKCLKTNEFYMIKGFGRIRLIYISQENNELVLERTRNGTQIHFLGHVFGDALKQSYEEQIKKRGWTCLTLTPDDRINSDFGIELISVSADGAAIRMIDSKETLYVKNGNYFDLKKSIKGANRIQLVNCSTNEQDRGVLLRIMGSR